MDMYDALKTIERFDPDGGEIEPTEAAYAAHKEWAVRMFGEKVWDAYQRGGWDYDHSWVI